MRPATKAKLPEAPAPRYQANGLLKPGLDELKNQYTPETLTATMRAGCVSEYEFALLRLVRAKDRRDRAVVALAQFQRLAYPRDAKFKSTLARLQREESEAEAELHEAERLRSAAEAA
jgi:hypothetical protein